MRPSIRDVRRYALQWANQFGLAHWELKLRWMTEDEATGEYRNCNGFCIWSNEYTYAEIAISRESENWRHTVVHELLHVRLDGHKPINKRRDTNLEITINALTRAFLG